MPNGVIDFPKGEGYRHVDVAVASVLRAAYASGITSIKYSYDIVCKYSVNFVTRVLDGNVTLLDPKLRVLLLAIKWLIGKFHIGGHQKSCSEKFAFNYTMHVGRMSGELVETIWADFNWFKHQTKEMTPGGRRDLLNDAFNQWNFTKAITIVDHTQKLYLEAVRETKHAEERVCDIERTIGEEGVSRLEANSAGRGGEQYQPDPALVQAPTRAKVLRELQDQEDALDANQDLSDDQDNNLFPLSLNSAVPSAITWVDNALSLEKKQIKYREAVVALASQDLPDLAAKVSRSKAKIDIALLSHYDSLRLLAPQLATAPGIVLTPGEAHSDPILVPSRINLTIHQEYGLGALATIEGKLRIGTGHEAVEATKKALGLRSWMTQHARTASSYTMTTRAQQSVRRSEMVVKSCAKLYNRHWAALDALKVPVVELKGLQELKSDHLVVLGSWFENESYKPLKATDPNSAECQVLPWIWRMHRINPVEDASPEVKAMVDAWNEEVIRLEWVHARAARDRWREEKLLLIEEAHRIASSLVADAAGWRAEAVSDRIPDPVAFQDSEVLQGYKAHLFAQADVYDRLAKHAKAASDGLPPHHIPFNVPETT